jgi:DNA-binding transcriptional regulator LsrR (DeoR family)
VAQTQPSERLLAATAARRYFLYEESKQDIADALGISRFKVARLIDQARADGLVRITVAWPGEVDEDRSARLSAHLGVTVRVAASIPDQPEQSVIGAVTTDAVRIALPVGGTIGISWGHAVRSFVEAAERLPAANIVQLIGGLDAAAGDMSGDALTRVLAESIGSRPYVLQAPLAVQSPAVARALSAEPNVRATLDLFADVDVAVVGVGAWPPETLNALLTSPERRTLQRAGALADVCGHVVNADGELITSDFDQRLVAISVEQLKAVPNVIAVASGQHKVPAIAAACASGMVDGLVTDEITADGLLSYADV